MKQNIATVLIFFSVLFEAVAQSQSDSFFVNDINLKSSSSQIEVTPKGDTIMVAYFDGNDIVNQSTRSGNKKYIGTPFYGNRWFPGTVSSRPGDESKGMIAFNVVDNKISYSPDNNTTPIDLEPSKFVLNGVVFEKLNIAVPKAGNFYYSILEDGNVRLVKQYGGRYVPIVEKEEKAYTNTKEKEYEGKFVKQYEYYLLVGSEMILVNKKSKLIKDLGSLGSKAEQYIKSEKLDIKSTSDLIKLTQHLNS